jgi:hypothetical protein
MNTEIEKVKIEGINYYKIPGNDIFELLPGILPETTDKDKLKVTLHWSAGNYSKLESDYQILSTVDGCIYVSEYFLKYSVHQHTWRRNTYNIGVSFMAMYNKLKFPVTDLMIESVAKVQAVLHDFYDIPWTNFKDHKYYSDLDKYEPQFSKWDCRTQHLENGKLIYLFDKVLQKSKWYYEKYLKG